MKEEEEVTDSLVFNRMNAAFSYVAAFSGFIFELRHKFLSGIVTRHI